MEKKELTFNDYTGNDLSVSMNQEGDKYAILNSQGDVLLVTGYDYRKTLREYLVYNGKEFYVKGVSWRKFIISTDAEKLATTIRDVFGEIGFKSDDADDLWRLFKAMSSTADDFEEWEGYAHHIFCTDMGGVLIG